MTRLAIRNYANAGNARKWLLMMARSLHCPPDRLTLLLYLSFSVFHHLIGHSADLHLIETACTDPSRELQLNGATSIRQMTFSRVFLLGLHLTESHSWLVVCPQWAVSEDWPVRQSNVSEHHNDAWCLAGECACEWCPIGGTQAKFNHCMPFITTYLW